MGLEGEHRLFRGVLLMMACGLGGMVIWQSCMMKSMGMCKLQQQEGSSGTHGILAFFCAASMQHEGRRVNVRRCPSSRRGDASFTRFHRMTRSRFSLARDDPLFHVGLEASSPPCYTWR